MRDQEFEHWLRKRYPNPNSWTTFRSETRKIAKYKGDLDDLYEMNRFQGLLDSFHCSKSRGILPTDDIPHNADPYVTAGFRRQCIKLYSQFYQENPRASVLCLMPGEIEQDTEYLEGSVQTVVVNRYERDAAGRKACIHHYGTTCVICGFDFGLVYGEIGNGFIHVHHLTELSSIGEEYGMNPIKDLRPVCPNCHAMLHQKRPSYSIEEIKALLEQAHSQ